MAKPKRKSSQAKQQQPPKPAAKAALHSESDESARSSDLSSMIEESPEGKRTIPRVVSLIILLAVVLLVAAMFFRVMLQFIAPLFLAAVLVVVFEPVHKRVMSWLPGRTRWAALATTILVALVILLPATWLGINAFGELAGVVTHVNELAEDKEKRAELVASAKDSLKPLFERYESISGQEVDLDNLIHAATDSVVNRAPGYVVGWVGDTFVALVGILVGLAIMSLALYYFFADGPSMVVTLMHLSPLDDDYEKELLEKFAEVSRAVIIATLSSAVVQGLLAGIAYYFALDAAEPGQTGPPIFLLTAATMLCAIIPFAGAAAVWVPVALWVYFVQQDTVAAIALAVWGAAVVSMVDNLIKPYVLHGQSNLHPLLALLSVLGGVSVLGPVGILVGPMLVAFLQALLNMLRKELDDLRGEPMPLATEGIE